MKSLFAKLCAILIVMGLALSFGSAWAADWKELAEATTGSFRYDAASITSPSAGLVRVWIHNEAKHETSLVEFNCGAGGYRVLDVTEYDETGKMTRRHDYYDNPGWLEPSPKSILVPLRSRVCVNR